MISGESIANITTKFGYCIAIFNLYLNLGHSVMKSPCPTCENALEDKRECSLNCHLRHEYCRSLGIPIISELPVMHIVERKTGITAPIKSPRWVPVKPPSLPILPESSHKPPPKTLFREYSPRGMFSKGGRLEKATVLLKEGLGNRETHRMTGMALNTVAKLRKALESRNGSPFLCPCGKLAVHQGMCCYRRNRAKNTPIPHFPL